MSGREPLIWFELRCFTDDGSEDGRLDAVIDLDESQIGFHPEGTPRHPGERAITIHLSGKQMQLAKAIPSLVQRTILSPSETIQPAPEDPTPEMIEAGVRMHQTPRTGQPETLVHDIWQSMYDAWLAGRGE